jgi:hypothetical protein
MARCGSSNLGMRRLAAALVVVFGFSLGAAAQERDRSFDRINLAIRQPPLVVPTFEPPAPAKLGPLTFETPVLRGEFIRLSLPAGEYVSRVAREISAANRRRQESAARRRVQADLKAFIEQRRPKQ